MNLEQWWQTNKPDAPFPGENFILKQMGWGGDETLGKIRYDAEKGYSIDGENWFKPTAEALETQPEDKATDSTDVQADTLAEPDDATTDSSDSQPQEDAETPTENSAQEAAEVATQAVVSLDELRKLQDAALTVAAFATQLCYDIDAMISSAPVLSDKIDGNTAMEKGYF
jgi:hypothetical protein